MIGGEKLISLHKQMIGGEKLISLHKQMIGFVMGDGEINFSFRLLNG
jgi:hypothetical protein